MRDLDDGLSSAREILSTLHSHTGHAHIVGVTGNPGSGKSTLVDQLITQARKEGQKVGVVAIDPTSPFTGGAILGDRVRMQGHASDPEVFIRSLATRGQLGGLSRSTLDIVRVMDAMGKDLILIETVGVGQDEIEVTRAAHTSVVVVVPGLGDEIQAIKAGILEIADIFVVNKSDRPGADKTAQELRMMVELFAPDPGLLINSAELAHHHPLFQHAPRGVAQGREKKGWELPILLTVAARGEGIEALSASIKGHHQSLKDSGGLLLREEERARSELVGVLENLLLEEALARLGKGYEVIGEMSKRIALRQADPYTLAKEVSNKLWGVN